MSRGTRIAGFSWLALFVLVPPGVVFYSLYTAFRVRGGAAPRADFATRREWGADLFGPYLHHIDAWAAQAEVLQRDVGRIQRIAPIGAPNRYHPGFTDGAHAVMNLEVIGTQGQGVLFLPFVEILSTNQLQGIGEGRWTFAGRETLVVKSGNSYLAEHGLEDLYFELVLLAEQNAAEKFVDRWNDFVDALDRTSLRRSDSPFRNARLIPGLHDHYREPLLIQFGAALAELDRSDESAVVYRQAVDSILTRARSLLQEEDERDLARVGRELRRANELLRLANKLDPGNRSILNLARERVTLQYLHTIGGRPAPIYSGGEKEDRQWAKKCLGAFYREAKEYAGKSPYLNRTLGGVRSVHPHPRAGSQLAVNNRDVYEASIYLEVAGSKGRGTLLVFIRENHRRHMAIDLFADNPRSPDYPFTIRSPDWTPDGGAEVKLSARTGDLRDKRAKPRLTPE